MFTLKLQVSNLDRESAQKFEAAARSIPGVQQVDSWPGRAIIAIADDSAAPNVIATLREKGFDIVAPDNQASSSPVSKVRIDGMTCRSCEITVERKFKRIPGVRKVDVNASAGVARIVCEEGRAPDLKTLQTAVGDEKYVVRSFVAEKDKYSKGAGDTREKPSFGRMVGLFTLVFVLGWLFSKLGLFNGDGFAVSNEKSFAGALLLGLVAGSSACLAVAGGLMLSAMARFRERHGGDAALAGRMRPVFMFVTGRVLSYGVLGGAIGAIGQSLAPSPFVTGALIVLAAAYMVTMGLDMLGVAPAWLKGLMPRMPKFLSHRILDAEGKEHPVMPFALGAGTFFLPCGFTQALQLYVLTTGSFAAGASILGGYALGTAPALLALGWASNGIRGRAGKFFFQFSGALVVVLGLSNVQNGFTVAGYSLAWPSFSLSATQAQTSAPVADDPNVVFDGKTQIIKMKLGADPFYSPSDEYTVRAGVPVRMEIAGIGTGCRSIFQIPKFGVSVALNKTMNVVEFTPDKTGKATFSCSMGMFGGTLHVVAGS